ncbi:hypothetical protein ACFLYU_00495 [Candidatus Dependentiae bacterium]
MKFFNVIQEYFWGYNAFFYWRNTIEVLFFALLIYYFSLWLKHDRKHNLLPYFYGYCMLTLVSHFTQLTTISYVLFLFSPVAIMLFILLHQTTLQKNFVALKNITPAKHVKTDWPQELIRSFLFAINNNREIYCVIENSSSIQEFMYSPLVINANIEQGLIHILQESQTFDQKKILWLNTNGQIVGVNASWREKIFQEISEIPQTPNTKSKENKEAKTDELFKQNAMLLSSKTDTLFLHITPKQRTFDIIFNGELFNNISSENVLHIIKKYAFAKFKEKDPEKLKGELINENYTQKNLFKQRSN